MIKSRYTFLTDLHGSDDLLVVNLLNGSVDLLEKGEVGEFQRRFSANDWEGYGNASYLLERGYLFRDSAEEEKYLRDRYEEFVEESDQTPIQLIFAVTYACNFSCSYCFQGEYNQSAAVLDRTVVDAFFNYVDRKFADEPLRPYITLFGGEPLLSAPAHRRALEYYLERARNSNYETAIVTNGYTLADTVPLLVKSGAVIREIQVTLDGDAAMHDRRRRTGGGEATFDRIVAGIDLALKSGFRINLRSVVDKENVNSLPALAEFCDQKGWLDLPGDQFQTTLGRNYELHTCNRQSGPLFDRLEMWREFIRLAADHPVLKKYHTPGFHGMRHLSETGELPAPIFDGCPAAKKEWAFDVNGDIYGCTASVGVPELRLGNFLEPDANVDAARTLLWRNRDVLTIPQCRDCPESLMCGGGCGVLARKNHGTVMAPDCRPVRELMGLGAVYYGIHNNESEGDEG